jgi:hypothetical protein
MKYASKPELVLSNRLVRLRTVTILSRLEVGQSILLFPAALLTLLLQVNPHASVFGDLEVACWPLVPKFAGSHTAEAVGFLGRKNRQHAFLRRESKAVGPM